MIRTRPTITATAVAVLLAALALAVALRSAPAEAAFPGTNGLIAFELPDADPDRTSVLTINEDGSDERTLTDNGNAPNWSPNGKKIVFSRNDKLFSMNADGGKQKRLTSKGCPCLDPAYSPNGKKVAYVSKPSNVKAQDIRTIKTNGKKSKQVTDNKLDEFAPAWSPDGKWIAYSKANREGNDTAIFKIKPNGKKRKQLTKGSVQDSAPDWSPNGKRIAFERVTFLATEALESDVLTMKPNGKKHRKIVDGVAPAYSPDGKRIAFSGLDAAGQVLGLFTIDASGAGGASRLSLEIGALAANWQPR